jgi:hypothetical protein
VDDCLRLPRHPLRFGTAIGRDGSPAGWRSPRCRRAVEPGATTLPPTKKLHFNPNIATISPAPGYTLTSDRVKGLHPQGRIYATDIAINDGTKPIVHQRHQVILDGRAYQFSAC